MNSTLSTPNPVVLITGAARRIGACFAENLHQQGFDIAIHYRGSKSDAEQLAIKLNEQRQNSAIILQADLANFEAYQPLVDQATAHWGRLDVLVNNASSFYPTPMGQITEKQWFDLMSSNLKAPLFLSQAAVPHLQKTRGCIVNMVDIHSLKPLKDHPVYCAAKSGLYALTRSMAKDLGAKGIRVNGISPGSIMWPEGAAEVSEEQKQDIIKNIALGHNGEPQDLANTLLFLVSEKAKYITGQIIAVDGARSLA